MAKREEGRGKREEGRGKMRESISLSVSLSDVGHQSDKSVCQTSVISLTGCRGTGFQHRRSSRADPDQIQRSSRAGASQSLGRGAAVVQKCSKCGTVVKNQGCGAREKGGGARGKGCDSRKGCMANRRGRPSRNYHPLDARY